MDPQLLRRGGQRRERKTANVETVCECVRDGPGSSGCPIFSVLWGFSNPERRSRHSSIPKSRYRDNLDAGIPISGPKTVSRVNPKALPELPRCAPDSAAGGSVTRCETRFGQDASAQRDPSFSFQKTTDLGRQS